MKKDPTLKVKPINAIPLKTAQKWAKRWSKREGNYNRHHHVNAFLIPKVDLLEVLAEGVDAVRAYIGVDDKGIEKLMIVGTKLNPETGIYVDMIGVGATDATNGADDIYDFSQPCPSTCDPNSPMFQ
ncbi:hypothetical protein SAMN05444395_102391 [Flavobacterium fryxellicola]|uniref:Uncharacterized protein n=1 Tax=Flavobacterium fryxellicola TaxID=249352 RepID=A0A167Y084_9FLAO|nr:hypothetical protein [Flavobacterium fryxellicola]OAB28884.1 hypothetical protein FBFR_05340 [Flavobacterium fryxellicola]SHN60539.1 hypothetical protein SAMN05444395_102391 [Flavobacterium fryxellicola]